MIRIIVFASLLCVAMAANAEVIEFEMTGLTGSSGDSLKVDSLVYHGPTAVVNAVSFRVTGDVNDLGEICCGGPEHCPGDAYPWFMTWYGSIGRFGDPVYGEWVASCPDYLDQVVPFDQIDVAESQNGFPSLMDGDAFAVKLYFGKASWIGDCELIRPPSGTMISVTVRMDVTATLPTESTTWGRVKTLFN